MASHDKTNLNDRWDATGNRAFSGILKRIHDDTQRALQESGLIAISSHWFYLIAAVNHAPAPISANALTFTYPYTSPRKLKESLQILSAQGYLKPVGGLQYVATDKAISAIETVSSAQSAAFSRLSFLPADEEAELARLLMKVVDAIREADDIPTPQFDEAAVRPITDEMSSVEVIARALSLLNRFRVDMHNASWRSDAAIADNPTLKGIDGIQWEALSTIWYEKARTATDMVELMPYRGYRKADYSGALKKLVKRGWLVEREDGYHLTEDAIAIREDAEARTTALFYRVWDVLPDEERARLDTHLANLAVGV